MWDVWSAVSADASAPSDGWKCSVGPPWSCQVSGYHGYRRRRGSGRTADPQPRARWVRTRRTEAPSGWPPMGGMTPGAVEPPSSASPGPLRGPRGPQAEDAGRGGAAAASPGGGRGPSLSVTGRATDPREPQRVGGSRSHFHHRSGDARRRDAGRLNVTPRASAHWERLSACRGRRGRNHQREPEDDGDGGSGAGTATG